MKAHLGQLPTLSVPQAGEVLYLYLATSQYAVSAVLIREDDEGVQRPVYYVSKMLQRAELRYTMTEKIVLALVNAARRLRQYFQAHPIVVLTNQPVKQVLLKPEASGRLMKWAVELGKHDISYKSKTVIKAQALADFICEMPMEMSTPELNSGGDTEGLTSGITLGEAVQKKSILFVDGASNEEGSGAGILLTSPEGKEWAYALRFNFKATNNEAEYEALITGLKMAQNMQAQHIDVFSDSQVVVQ